MEPRIETFPEKHFIGIQMRMSFADFKVAELWRGFMPRRNEIQKVIGKELYSIELYPENFFLGFNPTDLFDKWAAVEVEATDPIPEGMEVLTVPKGLYAVFVHHGPVSTASKTFQYIFGTWIPQSVYVVDHRPHFGVMGEGYNKDDPNAEEELWIPIKTR